jgi:hypothetical protein
MRVHVVDAWLTDILYRRTGWRWGLVPRCWVFPGGTELWWGPLFVWLRWPRRNGSNGHV